MTPNTSKLILFNFPCMQVSFDGQKHIFWSFFALLGAPYFGWHKHQRCIVAKYYDYGQLLFVLFLQL